MRGKKAKLIRRIAKEAAYEHGLQEETQYDAKGNCAHSMGTIVVSHCDRALVKQLKILAGEAKNIPAQLFHNLGIRAI